MILNCDNLEVKLSDETIQLLEKFNTFLSLNTSDFILLDPDGTLEMDMLDELKDSFSDDVKNMIHKGMSNLLSDEYEELSYNFDVDKVLIEYGVL